MNYVKQLRFMEMPDYQYIINLLFVIAAKESFEIDFEYDWRRRRTSQ
jgi:hypothetical protein